MTQHARRRARERYGIELNVGEAINMIRNNRAKMVHRITNEKAIYRIIQDELFILVLYHRLQQKILTVLPADHPIGKKG